MKKLKKLKKWIAGFTALSMLLVFFPQTAFAAAPIMQSITPVNGAYVSGITNFVFDFSGTDPLAYLELDIYRPGDVPGTRIQVTLPADNNIIQTALLANPSVDAAGETLSEIGITSASYNSVAKEWSVTVNTAIGTWPDGDTAFYIEVGDNAGNQWGDMDAPTLEATRHYTFDNTTPTVAVTSPSNESLVTGWVDINGTITDTNTSTYSVNVYDSLGTLVSGTGNINQDSSFTDQLLPSGWNASTATEGIYTIRLNATDKAGNLDSDSIAVYVDRTAPNVPVLTSPANGSVVNSIVSPNLVWGAVTDLIGGPVKYQIKSSVSNHVNAFGVLDNAPITSGWQLAPIFAIPTTEGVYYWQVRSEDRFENSSNWSAPWMVTIDNTNPEINKIYDVSDLITKTDVIGTTVTIVKPTTFAVDAMDFWQEVENPDGISTYKWSANDSVNVVFETPNSGETKISALKDGTYTITLEVFDKAGNSSGTKSFTLVWYEVPPVTDLYAVTGSGFVDLHWNNPSDTTEPEIVGLNVYRSLVKGKLGDKLNDTLLTSDTEYYPDELVINGKTYYYTVAVLDELGNESQNNKQIAVTPTAPTRPTVLTPLIASTAVYYPTGGPENPDILGDQNQGGEVKSGEADQNNSEGEDDNNRTALPAVGIALLIILALVGLYLLYLQNPKWFSWLLFWKKKK